jgi:ubiquinone/menaquinone biosynthesis C-methylase UbiE
MSKEKQYWVKKARYDWYEARVRGNLFERMFYNVKIKYILSCTDLKDKRILDMGCGTGLCTNDLYQKSKKTVGIDISPWAIKRAKQNFGDIPFYVMDSENTKFGNNYFDVIVNTGLIQYLENPQLTIDEMHRILKLGGVAIVEVPWRHSIYNSRIIRKWVTGKQNPNDEPVNVCYSANELKHLFDGFECYRIRHLLLFALYGVFKKSVRQRKNLNRRLQA